MAGPVGDPSLASCHARAKSWLPVAGFLSGVMLMLPGVFPMLAPIQAIAFVPLLVALRWPQRRRRCLYAGVLMGLGFVAPQVPLLRLPPAISLILVCYFVALLLVFVSGSCWLFRPRGLSGCLAFAAFAAVLDWVTVALLPMWGTAQSFVRCWSWYPGVIGFSSVTGMPGIMFVLAAVQALAVDLAFSRQHPLWRLVILASVLVAVVGIDAAVAAKRLDGHLKVAAVGWAVDADEPGIDSPEAFERLYAGPVGQAARQGARLVVAPETAFAIHDDPAFDAFAVYRQLAREHDVYLAVGYLDAKSYENRVAFIGPTEGVMARYAKVHLTPFESNPVGRGEPVIVTIDGISVGAMICQDDNYTDISRRYGREGTQIVVVPTNDWTTVRKAHFQSTIHRAIESRFGIVRAASNGISAIVSPKGRRLATMDHITEGPGLVMADMPIYRGHAVFSRFGRWFVLVCVVLAIACSALRSRSK